MNEIFDQIFKYVIIPKLLKKDNHLQHSSIKGCIFAGPPGTGKTMLARTIGQLLNANVQVLKGPDILDKYVGKSAASVKALFADAESDWGKYGYLSPLHIILIDEIDIICGKRSAAEGEG